MNYAGYELVQHVFCTPKKEKFLQETKAEKTNSGTEHFLPPSPPPVMVCPLFVAVL